MFPNLGLYGFSCQPFSNRTQKLQSPSTAHQTQNLGQVAQAFHHPRQMNPATNMDEQGHGGGDAIAFGGLNVVDVAVHFADRRRHPGEYAPPVDDIELDLHRKITVDVLLPLHLDPLFRVLAVVDDVLTHVAVNDDTATGAEKAHDGVARQGPAAAAESDHGAFGTLDEKRLLRVTGCGLAVLVIRL